MESRKKTLKKKALKNKKENMQESNIYTIMHCRLARLYLSGNDVLSLPDDTEILVNVSKFGNMVKVNFMGMIHLKNIFTMSRMVNALCAGNHI